MIMLSGEWLRDFGFVLNQRLKVFSSQGKIVIEGLWNEPAPKINAPEYSPSPISHPPGYSVAAAAWLHPGMRDPNQLRDTAQATER